MNKEILITHEQIQTKVSELASKLTEEYRGKNPIVIGIMRGSLYFLSDLTRYMDIDLELDVMSVASYVDNKSSGTVQILKDTSIDLTDRDVIIVEDIIDTGVTMQYLVDTFNAKKAKSVKTVVIFEKANSKVTDVRADLVGFIVPDDFLIGYGLDFNNNYRHLKDVYKVIQD